MTEKIPKSFVMYKSFANQFALLSMEQRGALITAIFNYNSGGDVRIELDPIVAMAFSCMKEAFDRDREAYEAKCERNRENGKKGGRPRKNQNNNTEGFFWKTEKAYNDNDNDNDNKNKNNSDNGNKEDICGANIHIGAPARETPAFSVSDVFREDAPLDVSCDVPLDAPLDTPCDTPFDVPLDASLDIPCDTSCEVFPDAPLGVPLDTPCDAPLGGSALSAQEEINFLLSQGLEEGYILPRLDRAREYASKQGRRVTEVLLEWRKKDGGGGSGRKKGRGKPSGGMNKDSGGGGNDGKAMEMQAWFDAMTDRLYGDGGA